MIAVTGHLRCYRDYRPYYLKKMLVQLSSFGSEPGEFLVVSTRRVLTSLNLEFSVSAYHWRWSWRTIDVWWRVSLII